MESMFDALNTAFNSLADYISVDFAIILGFLSTPGLALQHFVIAPVAEFFAGLF